MSFFDSEVVRAEMTEISELQEEVYKSVFDFTRMNKEEQIHHVGMLERLLNKQKILYTRMSLSDDPEAKEMKKRMGDSAAMMGLPPDIDMNVIFKNMTNLLKTMREQIDKAGTDL